MPAGIWTNKLDMPSPGREGHGAANIGIQKSFIMYGDDGPSKLIDNDEYDNVGNFWTVKNNAPSPARGAVGSTTIGDDNAYCWGSDVSPYRDNSAYSKSGDSWQTLMDSNGSHRGCGAGAVTSSEGYVYGGWAFNTTCAEYNVSGNSWTDKASLSTSREGGAFFTLQGELFWVAGSSSTSVESYEPVGDTWTTRNTAGSTSLSWPAGAAIAQKGYMCGGQAGGGVEVAQTLELEPVGDSWTTQTDLIGDLRRNHACTEGGTSEFYAFAGQTDAGGIQRTDQFHMPTAPWVENLSPSHEETDVAEDANVTFDVLDNNGVDTATLNVTINGVPVITGGVFQAGYNGTITEIV